MTIFFLTTTFIIYLRLTVCSNMNTDGGQQLFLLEGVRRRERERERFGRNSPIWPYHSKISILVASDVVKNFPYVEKSSDSHFTM